MSARRVMFSRLGAGTAATMLLASIIVFCQKFGEATAPEQLGQPISTRIIRVTQSGLQTESDSQLVSILVESLFPELPAADRAVPDPQRKGDLAIRLTYQEGRFRDFDVQTGPDGKHTYGSEQPVLGDLNLTLELLPLVERYEAAHHWDYARYRQDEWIQEHGDGVIPLLLKWMETSNEMHAYYAVRFLMLFGGHLQADEIEAGFLARLDRTLKEEGAIPRDTDIAWEQAQDGEQFDALAITLWHALPVVATERSFLKFEEWLAGEPSVTQLERMLDSFEAVAGLPPTPKTPLRCGTGMTDEIAKGFYAAGCRIQWARQDAAVTTIAEINALAPEARLEFSLQRWDAHIATALTATPPLSDWNLKLSASEAAEQWSRRGDRPLEWARQRATEASDAYHRGFYWLVESWLTGTVDPQLIAELESGDSREQEVAAMLREVDEQLQDKDAH